MKSQPSSPCGSFSLPDEKIVDELIFSGRGDLSEVPSKLLAVSSGCIPLQCWNVDDEVT